MEDHRQTCLWVSDGFLQRHSWEGEDLLQRIARVTKHGSIITKPALNNRVWSGNTPHLLKQKNPSPRPLQVNWCCSCFGTVKVWYWNITLGKAPLFLLHHTVKYWHKSWSHWVTTSTEFCCPRGLFFSTIKHVLILQQPLLKPSGSWNLNCSLTPPHSLALTPLDCHMFGPQKEALHMAEDLPVLMKFRTWCKYGYDQSWKLFLQITTEGVWVATQYALRKEVILLRNDTLCMCHIVVHEVINKFTLLFDFALYYN
jgi:hypothetical protein